MTKVSLAAALVASSVLFGGGAAVAGSCASTCNAANMQCQQAGKNDTVCLNAWHQCKVGCASPAPAKLKVTQPSPGTVVIKTAAAAHAH